MVLGETERVRVDEDTSAMRGPHPNIRTRRGRYYIVSEGISLENILKFEEKNQVGELTLMADALGEGPGALAGDVHKPRIPGDLVEDRKDALRLRQKAAVEIGFELQQSVIDSQAVIAHAPSDQVEMLLLARQSFENLQQLCRG